LAWLAVYIPRQYACELVTHLSTNRARHHAATQKAGISHAEKTSIFMWDYEYFLCKYMKIALKH